MDITTLIVSYTSPSASGFVTLYHGTDLSDAQCIQEIGLNAEIAAIKSEGQGNFWCSTEANNPRKYANLWKMAGNPVVVTLVLPMDTLVEVGSMDLLTIHTQVSCAFLEFDVGGFEIVNASMTVTEILEAR